jgi:pimeloyl-ACP methyl ester carboxylesterase
MSEEKFVDVGRGINLCYETIGDPADPPLLLVMGLGMQMIAWPDEFCAALAGRGYLVVRFDNRDAGRSTSIKAKPPGLAALATRRFGRSQYSLADMADDTAGLLRELDLAPAHIVGASLGGMIAQSVAVHYPDSVRTLTSIMSTTGSRWKGQPAPAILPLFLTRPPREREAVIAHGLKLFSAIGSPGFPRDEATLRALIEAGIDRAPNPAGTGRQLGAILKSGDRTRELRNIKAPTLVIHGTGDRLVQRSGGAATAAAIPGSRLLEIEGMGHDLPEGAWPQIVDAIAAQAERFDESRAAA